MFFSPASPQPSLQSVITSLLARGPQSLQQQVIAQCLQLKRRLHSPLLSLLVRGMTSSVDTNATHCNLTSELQEQYLPFMTVLYSVCLSVVLVAALLNGLLIYVIKRAVCVDRSYAGRIACYYASFHLLLVKVVSIYGQASTCFCAGMWCFSSR